MSLWLSAFTPIQLLSSRYFGKGAPFRSTEKHYENWTSCSFFSNSYTNVYQIRPLQRWNWREKLLLASKWRKIILSTSFDGKKWWVSNTRDLPRTPKCRGSASGSPGWDPALDTLAPIWPSPPGTFHILIGKFSYFVIRFFLSLTFPISLSDLSPVDPH